MDASPPPLPAAVRWLLIVLLPAAGFVAGAVGASAVFPVASAGALAVLALFAGITGAATLLALGLALAPWLPAVDQGAPGDLDDGVPPASHPADVGWVGPAAAVLMGVGIGVVLGLGLLRPEQRYHRFDFDTWTRPFAFVVLAAVGATALLLQVHPPRGLEVAPGAHAPLHRLVARIFIRGTLAGTSVAFAGGLAALTWDRGPRWAELMLLGGGTGAILAGLVTLGETVAWRLPSRWRWPWLLLIGALVTPAASAAVVFAIELVQRGDPLAAGYEAVGAVAAAGFNAPGLGAGLVLTLALPTALLAAARAGVLPYFGQRAPWPTLAQVPLAWLAAAAGIALFALTVNELSLLDLATLVPYLGVTAPALVLALRLAAPLEERLARRWVLLTGGAR
ncbi:MAG: hypothetical protein M9894_17845 [Planctomycetes bacterium]|nr:hypothetical protein [Planctomycetota bacterium]